MSLLAMHAVQTWDSRRTTQLLPFTLMKQYHEYLRLLPVRTSSFHATSRNIASPFVVHLSTVIPILMPRSQVQVRANASATATEVYRCSVWAAWSSCTIHDAQFTVHDALFAVLVLNSLFSHPLPITVTVLDTNADVTVKRSTHTITVSPPGFVQRPLGRGSRRLVSWLPTPGSWSWAPGPAKT